MSTQITELDANEFRRRLAGLSSPDLYDMGQAEPLARDLCVLMARHFGHDLDRKTLWDRIASGLETAAAKNPNGGSRLVNDALDHVRADPASVARDDDAGRMIAKLASDEEAGRSLARYINRSLYVAIVLGRQAWEENKATRKAPAQPQEIGGALFGGAS